MNTVDHSRGLLGVLSPSVRNQVLTFATERQVQAGEIVFREGDPSNFLYVVEAGRVSLMVASPPKGSRTLMTLGPGELFSWSSMVEPYRETCTVKAKVDSTIVQIHAKRLIDLCRSDHDVGFEIYRALALVLASRVRGFQLQIAEIFSADSGKTEPVAAWNH